VHLRALPWVEELAHTSVDETFADNCITRTWKIDAIIWSLWHDKIPYDEVEAVLLGMPNKKGTDYRRLLCTYDYKKNS